MADKPRRVMIGMPAHDHRVHVGTHNSLLAAIYELNAAGIVMDNFNWSGDSLICHARNVILAQFLASEATDLVFVDSDVSWEAGGMARLVTHQADFVAGVYRKKTDEESYPVNYLVRPELWADPDTGLLEVADIAMGFVRLTRPVVEMMTEASKDFPFQHPNAPHLKCFRIFDQEYEDGMYYGEDYVFCRKWRALGGRIWVDPEIRMAHAGFKSFEGTFGSWLKSRPLEGPGPELRGISGRSWPQVLPEVEQFANFLKDKGVKRYLEIGARYGDTFGFVMSHLDKDAKGVALDWPGADGCEADGLPVLRKTVAAYEGELIIGDSHDPEIIAKVRALGPFDAILIDGDHSYEGAKADWEAYGDLAPIVAFHDIICPVVEVPKLWNELVPLHDTAKIIADGSDMGFGVILDNVTAEQRQAMLDDAPNGFAGIGAPDEPVTGMEDTPRLGAAA